MSFLKPKKFQEIQVAKELNDYTFPRAAQSQKLLSKFIAWVKVDVILTILFKVFYLIIRFFENRGMFLITETAIGLTVGHYINLFLKALYIITAFIFFLYLVNVFIRLRMYERNIFRNDLTAYRFKKRYLKIGRFKEKRANIAREETKNKLEKKHKLEAYDSVIKSEVILTSREKPNQTVDTTYTVDFTPPKDTDASDLLKKQVLDRFVETLNNSSTKFNPKKNRTFFGELRPKLGTGFYYQGVKKTEKDVYSFDSERRSLRNWKDSYFKEHSFPFKPRVVTVESPLTGELKEFHFKGLSSPEELNKERLEKAKSWALSNQGAISEFLLENDLTAVFMDVKFTDRTAEMYFQLPETGKAKTKNSALDEMGKALDVKYLRTGHNVTILGNICTVSMTLPNGEDTNGKKTDDYTQMIDKEAILIAAFG